MIKIFVLALLLFIAPLGIASAADKATDTGNYTAHLLELNRIKAGHNPAFTLGKAKLSARIVDKNQLAIGKVEDIVLMPDGKFEKLLTTVDITGFREKIAFDMKSYVVVATPDTFILNLEKKQVKQNIEDFKKAAIIPYDTEAPLTLLSLKNAIIYALDGNVVARGKDVLIVDKETRVAALLVEISTGDKRGSILAIPFENIKAKHMGERAQITLSDEQVKTILSMAMRH